MSVQALATRRVPMVALKPCTSFAVEGDIYKVKDGLFLPTTRTVEKLLKCLDTFIVGTTTGNETVDPKFPEENPPVKTGLLNLVGAEELASFYRCNILGGTLIAYLKAYSFNFYLTYLTAVVESDDRQFFEVVYPIFEGYFEKHQAIDPKLSTYLKGVVSNNTGAYKLLHVCDQRGDEIVAMRQIGYLKRVFRFAVSNTIPYPSDIVKDNLVHSPESQRELYVHSGLFLDRLTEKVKS